MINLIANGCSHTAGAEIEFELQSTCYHKAWPHHLASLLNFPSVNLSQSGASADRVVRTTIEYFLKEKNSPSFNAKDYFCVVMWPGLYRTELFNGGFDNGWQPLVVGNDESYKKQMDKFSYTYYKSWTIFAKPHPQTLLYLHNIMLLQYFLVTNRIRYLFWSASNSAPHTEGYLQFYKSQIYNKRYPYLYDSEYCFTRLCYSNNQKISKFTKFSHYDENAQKWFAKYIFNYMKENKLL